MNTYIIIEKNRPRGGTLWTLAQEVGGTPVEISVHSSREGAELAKARREHRYAEHDE